jgi:hypothetical protein
MTLTMVLCCFLAWCDCYNTFLEQTNFVLEELCGEERKAQQKPKSHFTLKKGLEKGLRRCPAAAQSTRQICPSYKHFPPTPCFVHRVHLKPLYLERRLSSLCFVHISTFSLEQRLIDPVKFKLSRGSSSFL